MVGRLPLLAVGTLLEQSDNHININFPTITKRSQLCSQGGLRLFPVLEVRFIQGSVTYREVFVYMHVMKVSIGTELGKRHCVVGVVEV